MGSRPGVVDPDDLSTWPAAVRDFAEYWADRLRGKAEFPADLPLPEEHWDELPALLGGLPLRAYHCTRLTDEEVARVRDEGLVPLNVGLVESKIRNACASGHIDPYERDFLLGNSVFARDRGDGRRDQVCAVVGRALFDDAPRAVELLLSTWGGEATYWMHLHEPTFRRLQLLGRPSIVVVNLRLDDAARRAKFYPMLWTHFIGRVLDLPETFGDVFYFGAVAPEDIVGIWQPGDADYDRHAGLPSS